MHKSLKVTFGFRKTLNSRYSICLCGNLITCIALKQAVCCVLSPVKHVSSPKKKSNKHIILLVDLRFLKHSPAFFSNENVSNS